MFTDGSQRRPWSSLTTFNLIYGSNSPTVTILSFPPSRLLMSFFLHFFLHDHFSVPFCILILLIHEKKAGGNDNSTMNDQVLKMRENRGIFLEFSGAEINKREVSFSKIIFRVPMMRQNQREWLATDVSMNYVCVADTHQHYLLLFPSHKPSMINTHIRSSALSANGRIGSAQGFLFFFL